MMDIIRKELSPIIIPMHVLFVLVLRIRGMLAGDIDKLLSHYVYFNVSALQKGNDSGLSLWVTKSK